MICEGDHERTFLEKNFLTFVIIGIGLIILMFLCIGCCVCGILHYISSHYDGYDTPQGPKRELTPPNGPLSYPPLLQEENY